MAEKAYVDQGELSRWERGLNCPHPGHVRAIDDALEANGQLVAIRALIADLERQAGSTLEKEPSIRDEEDAMERRRLLQLATAGMGALGVSVEPVRRLLDLSLGEGFRSVEDWNLACDDHLHAMRTRRSEQVAADLGVDLFTLGRQLEASSFAEKAGLRRAAAVLSNIQANVLTGLGHHGPAIRWSQVARQAADASGDRETRVLVRAEEAAGGLYGQRPFQTVLRLLDEAERLTGKPSLTLLATRAKALALFGRHDEARQTLNALRDLTEKGASGDLFGFWTESQIHFAESWVYASAGDEAKADAARENTLRITGSHQYQTNVRLHEGLCAVVNGGVDEGMRRAAAVIDSLPASRRDTYIIETGQMVLRAVPLEQRDRPAVNEFREVLAAGAV
ncbi:hypothetical protein GCM10017600_02100 [Streptosporangium carneum]|uniref:XRE family transcriptional regulator n=1 Tax=Streptosporangium carneum TaxID=47481 RepID=A0A9W6MAK6_9ACTN|nr:hypothetical protein GCM10017600_02100 [Streptosporangium carneum]